MDGPCRARSRRARRIGPGTRQQPTDLARLMPPTKVPSGETLIDRELQGDCESGLSPLAAAFPGSFQRGRSARYAQRDAVREADSSAATASWPRAHHCAGESPRRSSFGALNHSNAVHSSADSVRFFQRGPGERRRPQPARSDKPIARSASGQRARCPRLSVDRSRTVVRRELPPWRRVCRRDPPQRLAACLRRCRKQRSTLAKVPYRHCAAHRAAGTPVGTSLRATNL